MIIDQDELTILGNTDFLLKKAKVIEKLNALLSDARGKLHRSLKYGNILLPKELNIAHGKISRGENYKGLPYLVLDYPAHFSKEHIFAFRTMCWWGHFFSFTLHLQGKFWEPLQKQIYKQIDGLADDYYICVNNSPWAYDYHTDNYQTKPKFDATKLMTQPFLKISRKISLHDWQAVPDTAVRTFEELSALTKPV